MLTTARTGTHVYQSQTLGERDVAARWHPATGADVYLTSDCLDTVADMRGLCADASNFNTGVMYLRSSKAARAFVGRWLERMRHAGPEPWLDDQACFAAMTCHGTCHTHPL